MKLLISVIFSSLFIFHANCQNNADAILGKWIIDKGNCIVQVFRQNNTYKAKVLWFDVKDKKPMDQWVDDKNPDASLRKRKLLGMEVVNNLKYDASSDQWVDGIIYDATTGKKWDSIVWLTKNKELKVKGYWVFKFLSQTKTFKRVE